MCPPNEMKPYRPFVFGLRFFCLFNIILDQLKEPGASGIFFYLRNLLAQTSAEIIAPSPKPKIMATPWLGDVCSEVTRRLIITMYKDSDGK